MGLSQELLVIRIGLEPESASTRMNRCELDKRTSYQEPVARLAAELNLPAAYSYAEAEVEGKRTVSPCCPPPAVPSDDQISESCQRASQ